MFSFPLNMKQIKRVAGLLTCFLLRASFPSLVWGQWIKYVREVS